MSFDVLKYVLEAKEELDRTLACKHTTFDDLYPYMMEQQTFFWYKRHAAWAGLLMAVRIAEGAEADWTSLFTDKQQTMITAKVLDKKVLDEWLEVTEDSEQGIVE